jgi:3-oxoacyl-[acyl-carrier protein] reductase
LRASERKQKEDEMDLRISGKRALVTGSSSGIGAATAELLAAEGVKVVIHGRDAGRAQAVADRIKAAGGEAVVTLGDLITDEAADSVAKDAIAAWGGIDILVNNAGGPSNAALNWDNIESDDWAQTFNLNTISTARMIKRCVPGMKAAGWGRVIQISSMAGMRGGPTIPDYNSVKTSLNMLTVSLSKALADTGITVNTVSPGLIVTPVLENYFKSLPENAGKSWDEIEPTLSKLYNGLVKRLGRPEDIAAAIAFLVSDRADHITGANLRVDGGMPGFVN